MLIGLDGVATEWALTLRDCLAAALAEEGASSPSETCLVAGEDGRLMLSAGLLEDWCCAGFAWVRVAGIDPQTPQPGDQTGGCGITTWQVTLEMGVARCHPVGDASAGPTCAQMTEVALLAQQDAAAMRRAVCCLAPQVEADGTGRWGVTGWEPFGPEGACTGGTMGVIVIVDQCQCG